MHSKSPEILRALVATTSIANTYQEQGGEEEKLQRRKEGRKEERRLEGEKAIARAADGERLGRTKRPKEPVLPKPRGENTITPLLGGA